MKKTVKKNEDIGDFVGPLNGNRGMTGMTPKEAIAVLARGDKPTARERLLMAELILSMRTVVENSAQVSLDMCESCDLSPKTCNGEAFKNISCPNKALIDAIRVVRL